MGSDGEEIIQRSSEGQPETFVGNVLEPEMLKGMRTYEKRLSFDGPKSL